MSNWFPFGKTGANKTYTNKAVCETDEGQTCYDITDKDIRYQKISGDVLVEDAALKAKVLATDAILAKANREVDLLRKFQAMYDDVLNSVNRSLRGLDVLAADIIANKASLINRIEGVRQNLAYDIALCLRHLTIISKTEMTVGGSATEDFEDDRIKEAHNVQVTMVEEGAAPVTIKTAKCAVGKITIVFSGDPSNDHKISYHVCK